MLALTLKSLTKNKPMLNKPQLDCRFDVVRCKESHMNKESRVFSCPDNRGSAPISGQMAKVLRFSSDFCFSHKILRVLPYEKIGAHRIKAIFHEF